MKVSIVIPCYNVEKYIELAFYSALAQTYRDLEVVLVDDGSTDLTPELVALYAERTPTARPVRRVTQANAGLSSARNAGIEKAEGDYLLPLDADDALHPLAVERMAEILDAEPETSIVYCYREDFGEIRRKIPTFDWETQVKILDNNYLCYASMYRREVWEKIGGYDPIVSRLGGMEDYDFWRRAYKAGFKGKLIPEYYFLYRIRAGQMSEGTTKNREKILSYIRGKDI